MPSEERMLKRNTKPRNRKEEQRKQKCLKPSARDDNPNFITKAVLFMRAKKGLEKENAWLIKTGTALPKCVARFVFLPHVLLADYLKNWLKTSKLLSQGLWRENFSTRLLKGEELKNLLMKEESQRASLKLNVKKLRSCHQAPLLYGKQKEKRWK